ncbi:hypothetical protein HYDPIDRAFT_177054 [Hydnomerulius pinastri MD-312]|uniref:Vacuolar sorting protein Vps3844 C-terminal domain-containing protein n=1 Tax=Hydnomerulius pinastri MD-312 TaxID=994086 RepID=A0A0C9WBL2_9AGAM|nr:hypothetical protein HYDPIDRAFT_177054 [Hydnomerulius pinastri MD-312]
MRGLSASLLFFGLSQAANVYLSPAESFPSRLSPQQANLVLAAHLGLEQFEAVTQDAGRLNKLFRERDFVGQGDQSALLLLVDEAHARDIIPPTFEPSFSFVESQAEPLPSFVKTCNQRASHAYSYVLAEPSLSAQGVPRVLDIFSSPTPANEAFLAEMSTLVEYLESSRSDRFAALQFTGIPQLAASYGRSSEHYQLATETLRAAIEAILADKSIHVALVTYAPSTQKRSPQAPQQSPLPPNLKITQSPQPIRQLASCLGSASACANATNSCSGHGECVSSTRAGQECFVCACTTTTSDAGKVQNWAGDMCERKDVSGPFVLITGTVVTLILLMGGSVSLLYAIGGHELPSILTGGVAGGVRRE